MGSPWPAALGARADLLSEELRTYTAAIPDGRVGEGAGRFEVVGTPRRWLRPVLALVGGGDLFPVWARDAPFTVRNTAVPGRPAVRAERRLRLADGRERVMRDEIVRTRAGVVDRIGVPPRIEAAFAVDVADGGLRLEFRAVRLRLGLLRLPLGRLAPRILLTERFDAGAGCQRVALQVDSALLGRLYEYAGTFEYRIRPSEEAS